MDGGGRVSWWGWYLAGLFTLPAGAYLMIIWEAAFNKRHGLECAHCGKAMGPIRKNWRITTELRWKAHYLRHWYRTRPNWTCKKENDHD